MAEKITDGRHCSAQMKSPGDVPCASSVSEFRAITKSELSSRNHSTFSISAVVHQGEEQKYVNRLFNVISFDGEKIKTVQCLFCSKTLGPVNFGCLSSHMIKCSRTDNFTCQVCSRHFTRKSHLKRHLFSVHNIGEHATFTCPYELCGKVFTERHLLQRHIRMIHSVKESGGSVDRGSQWQGKVNLELTPKTLSGNNFDDVQKLQLLAPKAEAARCTGSTTAATLTATTAGNTTERLSASSMLNSYQSILQAHKKQCNRTNSSANYAHSGGVGGEGGTSCGLSKIVRHEDHFGFIFSCGALSCLPNASTSNPLFAAADATTTTSTVDSVGNVHTEMSFNNKEDSGVCSHSHTNGHSHSSKNYTAKQSHQHEPHTIGSISENSCSINENNDFEVPALKSTANTVVSSCGSHNHHSISHTNTSKHHNDNHSNGIDISIFDGLKVQHGDHVDVVKNGRLMHYHDTSCTGQSCKRCKVLCTSNDDECDPSRPQNIAGYSAATSTTNHDHDSGAGSDCTAFLPEYNVFGSQDRDTGIISGGGSSHITSSSGSGSGSHITGSSSDSSSHHYGCIHSCGCGSATAMVPCGNTEHDSTSGVAPRTPEWEDHGKIDFLDDSAAHFWTFIASMLEEKE